MARPAKSHWLHSFKNSFHSRYSPTSFGNANNPQGLRSWQIWNYLSWALFEYRGNGRSEFHVSSRITHRPFSNSGVRAYPKVANVEVFRYRGRWKDLERAGMEVVFRFRLKEHLCKQAVATKLARAYSLLTIPWSRITTEDKNASQLYHRSAPWVLSSHLPLLGRGRQYNTWDRRALYNDACSLVSKYYNAIDCPICRK